MNDALVQAVLAFTLDARKRLELETDEQLEGCYGWRPDGTFGKGTALGLPEAAETRARLEAYAKEEAAAGVDAGTARNRLVREAAFTWLNRTVAFRMMEERGILRATFSRLHKANAFIYWLTDIRGETSIPASTPVNALSEGPVDTAYREFLLWHCKQLAAEVSVLFDPATLASRLCPRPAVLKRLAAAMNGDDLIEAWRAGNEETIGWVYEGFIEDENTAVFAKFAKGRKVVAEEIGAATQRFTPNWIVRFLVQNSLGRFWVEMHPDSKLAENLDYFVPLESSTQRPIKSAREITFLDPCCGSMHFGLLAFDLYAKIYREERNNAGKPGWPATLSAGTEEEIPELILTHNIHGIDIDLRAVQVSALALLLKARTVNPKAAVTDLNLACANVEQLTGGRLDAFISATPFSHPIYERILRRLAARLKDSDYLGSLLRIEAEIEELVVVERQRIDDLFQQLPGFNAEQFRTREGIEEFFGILADQIGQHLDHFVQSSRKAGNDASLFAREASKGLRFLRLVEKRYDVVATNPPYMSRRNMSDVMARHLDNEFKTSKGDLYAAFITRCVELTNPLGQIAMVTQQSFMFISSYEDMRADLRKVVAIESMAHLGPRAFPNITGEKVNTAAFVLRREPEAAKRERQVGTYFRLVKERDADAKRLAFESALAALRRGENHPQLFCYKQCNFDAVPGKPWVYWMPKHLRRDFESLPKLSEAADPRVGLQTSDNFRFLRFWWEIGYNNIGFACKCSVEAVNTGKVWFPHMKGGSFRRWWGNQEYAVNWFQDGREMKAWADPLYNNSGWSRIIKSVEFYFLPGATWSHTSSSGFSVRCMPHGFICNVEAMAAFPVGESVTPQVLTAILNSRVAQFALSALNPTLHISAGKARSLPLPIVGPNERARLQLLACDAIALAKKDPAESELSFDFIQPPCAIADRKGRKGQLFALESEIDAEVCRLYGLSEEDLVAIDRELNGAAIEDYDNAEDDTDAGNHEDVIKDIGDLSPPAWARSWISYALGTVLGRFEIGKPAGLGCGDFPESTVDEIRKLMDTDGVMPCDAGHPQDIAARAAACLELMLGVQEARDAIRTATDTEGDPIEALRG